MDEGLTYLKIGMYEINSTHPISSEDFRGIPCSLLALRAACEREVAAGRKLGPLQRFLDAWNANPGMTCSQVIALLAP